MLISVEICQYFTTASALTETNVKYETNDSSESWKLLLLQAGSHTVMGGTGVTGATGSCEMAGESCEKSQWQSRPVKKEEEEERWAMEETKEA